MKALKFEERLGAKHFVFRCDTPIIFAWIFSALGYGLTIDMDVRWQPNTEWWRDTFDTRHNIRYTKRANQALRGSVWVKSLSIRTMNIADFRAVENLRRLRSFEFDAYNPLDINLSRLERLEILHLSQWPDAVKGLRNLSNLREVSGEKLPIKLLADLPSGIEFISGLGAGLLKCDFRAFPNLKTIRIGISRNLNFAKTAGSTSVQKMVLWEVDKIENIEHLVEAFPNLRVIELSWVSPQVESALRQVANELVRVTANRFPG